MRSVLLPLLVFMVTGVAAFAQPAAPRIRPSRDVTVTYRVEGEATRLVPGGLNSPVTLSWDAAGQRLRAEADGRSQVALIDLRAHTGEAIDTALRIVLPLPIRANDLQPFTLEGANLVATGRDTVAGLGCTTYSFGTSQGPGTACLTPDGVPLRGQGTVGGKAGTFVATAVRYAPLPGDLFVVPPGYLSLAGEGGASGLKGLAQRLGRSNDLRRLLAPGP